jgi:hypothetical protein
MKEERADRNREEGGGTVLSSDTHLGPSATAEGVSYDRLHFAVSPNQPKMHGVTTYARLEKEFLDRAFVFSIIGQSHYIYTATDSFHEVCSCLPLAVDSDGAATDDISLHHGRESTFNATIDGLVARTNVTVESIEEFSESRKWSLAYRFAPDAFTTISIGTSEYTTWHTYPDLGVAVHTRTVFESGKRNG